jgi:hypothetical protein
MEPPDHEHEDEPDEESPLERNIKSRSTWLRLFFMLVVILLYGVSRVVLGAVVLVQFFFVLFTGQANAGLRQLGQSLATYTYEIIRYLTFNADERPFPFDLDWPSGPPGDDGS